MTNLHAGTPEIIVLDNRGKVVRQLSYCRAKITDGLAERCIRHTFNLAGYLESSIDARFYPPRQTITAGATVEAHTTATAELRPRSSEG